MAKETRIRSNQHKDRSINSINYSQRKQKQGNNGFYLATKLNIHYCLAIRHLGFFQTQTETWPPYSSPTKPRDHSTL